MKLNTSISILASAGLTVAATADITGAYVVEYSVTAADFDGSDVTVNVQDLYLSSDDAWEGVPESGDTVLNVYNLNLVESGRVNYFQSFTGTGWKPTNLGGPFDTPALRLLAARGSDGRSRLAAATTGGHRRRRTDFTKGRFY